MFINESYFMNVCDDHINIDLDIYMPDIIIILLMEQVEKYIRKHHDHMI